MRRVQGVGLIVVLAAVASGLAVTWEGLGDREPETVLTVLSPEAIAARAPFAEGRELLHQTAGHVVEVPGLDWAPEELRPVAVLLALEGHPNVVVMGIAAVSLADAGRDCVPSQVGDKRVSMLPAALRSMVQEAAAVHHGGTIRVRHSEGSASPEQRMTASCRSKAVEPGA